MDSTARTGHHWLKSNPDEVNRHPNRYLAANGDGLFAVEETDHDLQRSLRRYHGDMADVAVTFVSPEKNKSVRATLI